MGKKKKMMMIAMVASLTVAMAGCAAASPSETPNKDLTRLRLALHWTYPIAEWDGIVMAEELGLYKDAGLDVELQFMSGSTASLQAVAAGESDLGLASSDSILVGASTGVDTTVVANHLQTTSFGLIAPANSRIDDISDLKGRTVSSAAASPEQAMLRTLAKENGLDAGTDFRLTYVDPQAKCTVVLSGGADACTGQVNHQLIQLEDKGVDPTFLSFSSNERAILGNSIIANNDYLADQPEAVEAFLKATMQGYEAAADDLDAVVAAYVKKAPETDSAFLRKALLASHSLMYSDRTDEHGWGWMTDEAWQTLESSLFDAGILTKKVGVATVYTNEFLPEDAWIPSPVS